MNGHLLLAGLAAAAGYAVWAYFHPFRTCPRCKGKGTNRGSTRRRSGHCGRCHGSRQVKTLGARTLHRVVRALVQARRDRKDN
jgi:DnaJ-class molecular chaperone